MITSVKSGILIGFGLVVAVLFAVVASAAWLVSEHQRAVVDMEEHSARAALIQDARLEVATVGLLVQRYVVTGDETLLAEIDATRDAAVLGLQQVAASAAHNTRPEQRNALAQIALTGRSLSDESEQIITARQNGDVRTSAAILESIAPKFTEFRLALGEAADTELGEVSAHRAAADDASRLVMWVLIASGVGGLIVALGASFLIVRAILAPLSDLESTAREIGTGNMSARTRPTGPRELVHLAQTMNSMVTELENRESDLRLANDELRERNRQLLEARVMAATDGLTSLPNHRTFHERIREAVASAAVSRTPVSVIMLDLDHFKKVNDALGHMEGDRILRSCGEVLSGIAGDENVYRYGGDEFALILDGRTVSEAAAVAETLRRAVFEQNSQLHNVTISLGVAEFPSTSGSAEELIYEADAAMYAAKSAGKNRVCRWDAVSPAKTPTA